MAELIVGWLLGLLGGPITEWIRRGHRRRELIAAVFAELRECRHLMASLSWRLKADLGEADEAFLRWLLPIEQEEAEISGDRKHVEATELLLKAAAGGQNPLSRPGIAQGSAWLLKTYSLPLLESGLAELILLPLPLRREIFAIREQLDFFNQDVPHLADLRRQTFDATLTGANRTLVLADLDRGYRTQADRAYRIVSILKTFPHRFLKMIPQ